MLNVTETKLRDVMVDVARRQTRITYSDLVSKAGVPINIMEVHDRNRLSEHLLRVNEDEVDAGRPPIAVVVVRQDRNLPGQGFFDMCDQLKLRRSGEDDLALFIRLLRDAHKHWKV